jgi:hypothetical protein
MQNLQLPIITPIESMRQSGFIAQEVENAAIATGYDFNGIKKPQNEHDTMVFPILNL